MSGSQSPPGGGGSGQPGADPSMEDILASIRRILSEDAPQPAAAEEPHKAEDAPSDVLLLDQSMMVPEPQPEEAAAAEPSAEQAPPPEQPHQAPAEPESAAPQPRPEPEPEKPQMRAAGDDSLVAPEVMQAAATAVTSLVQRLSAERGTLVRSAGPTIEDLVREELRPLLKEWLDTHLPPLVERLVKAEIERVVGRVIP